MSLVSIVITCFNAQETIERAVLSAISQDWSEKEIIIIDDFSKDKSYKILSQIAQKNPEITLIRHNSNLGYPAALNTAIKNTNGEFIAIFDADDFNSKNRLSSQIKRIKEYEKKSINPMILCYSNRDVFKNNETKADHIAYAIGRSYPEPFGEEVAEYILGIPTNPSRVWGMFGSCTLMARKSLFNKVGSFDESFRRCAEWDFAIRASFLGAHFISVNKSLIKMFKTPSSYKAGRIPLIYSLKLRDKYKSYLESRGFFTSSKLIAKSNFYLNKKRIIIGLFYRILALITSPKLMFQFLKTKIIHIYRSS